MAQFGRCILIDSDEIGHAERVTPHQGFIAELGSATCAPSRAAGTPGAVQGIHSAAVGRNQTKVRPPASSRIGSVCQQQHESSMGGRRGGGYDVDIISAADVVDHRILQGPLLSLDEELLHWILMYSRRAVKARLA